MAEAALFTAELPARGMTAPQRGHTAVITVCKDFVPPTIGCIDHSANGGEP